MEHGVAAFVLCRSDFSCSLGRDPAINRNGVLWDTRVPRTEHSFPTAQPHDAPGELDRSKTSNYWILEDRVVASIVLHEQTDPGSGLGYEIGPKVCLIRRLSFELRQMLFIERQLMSFWRLMSSNR